MTPSRLLWSVAALVCPAAAPLARAAGSTTSSTFTVPGPDVGAAGGGSGGFGGGGGGGGFGGGGGGGTYVGSDPRSALFGLILIIGFFVAIWIMGKLSERAQHRVAVWSRQYAKWRDESTERKRKHRADSVPPAARTAAEDDPYFAPEAVTAAAAKLFHDVQAAWDDRDQASLGHMVGPDLMIEWGRRLDDFDAKGWHNRVQVKRLDVEYVGLTNRADDTDDRIVVRVAALLDDYVVDRRGSLISHTGNPSQEAHLREYWTLAWRDGRLTLASIEQDVEGEHNLSDPLVALPEEDVASIRDAVVVEQGVQNRVPAGTPLGELVDVDFADDALNAARDLALIDGRLDPDLIEVSVRRAISAWAEAVDGDDEALLEMAPPDIAEELLRPRGPKTRLVIRGPKMGRATVSKLAPKDPIRVAIDAKVTGVRYIEDRDTVDVVAGAKDRETTFIQRFVLQLDDDPDRPWKLVAAGEMPS